MAHSDRLSGSVVRITPNEVHVQEQFSDACYEDCWIKGSRPPQSTQSFPVRSLLQGEVITFKNLSQKRQMHPRAILAMIINVPSTMDEIGSDIGSDGQTLVLRSFSGRSIGLEHSSRHGQTLYSTVQRMSRRSLPFST